MGFRLPTQRTTGRSSERPRASLAAARSAAGLKRSVSTPVVTTSNRSDAMPKYSPRRLPAARPERGGAGGLPAHCPALVAALEGGAVEVAAERAELRGIRFESVKAHGDRDAPNEVGCPKRIHQHGKAANMEDINAVFRHERRQLLAKIRRLPGAGHSPDDGALGKLGVDLIGGVALVADCQDVSETIAGQMGDGGQELTLQSAAGELPDRVANGDAVREVLRGSIRVQDGRALLRAQNVRLPIGTANQHLCSG